MKKIKTSFETPLYDALIEYCGKGAIPFHMPGHKQGRGLPKSFFDTLSQIDLTELPGLDNLHWPEGADKKAQELAAEAFRAEHSYFLVNGSSSGLLASAMTICSPGKRVLVQRDSHISVVNGLMLAGAEPVFPKNGINADFGITDALEIYEVEKALEKNPDIAGVILTRPSYYGVCSDLQKIVELCHQYGKPVAVDEAHGAHLGFADFLPPSAMDCGADISVQSAHKTLPSLTQSAYLHLQGDLIDRQKLEFYLRVFQSTSPSYLLMASLDICRAIMQQEGAHLLDSLRG
ncbi:MAG: aminotransferase class I/II-fold pyridoxal phosphate-dependent enzyme, partial [Eubacteriales bacterium]|nr:aminotransferase class I/II-fold pyridoxal phosphate-dependent enzyme [Eubacteriales bacterium]